MSRAGFRGRGIPPRGRKVLGLSSGAVRFRNPQPNFNQPRRENHVPPAEFWLEHSPSPPWQQINGLPQSQSLQYPSFEAHRYRGRHQYCPGLGARGRTKRIRGEGRLRPGIEGLHTPDFGGMGLSRTQPEPLRLPPLGSEEERQQKIAETAVKLKQKLSSLTIGEPVNFWEDDLINVSFSNADEHLVTNRGIPELRHDPPELNLTINDFKDIGRVDPDSPFNSGEPSDVISIEKTNSKVQGAEKNIEDPKAWLTSDREDHTTRKNCNNDVNEPRDTSRNLANDDSVLRNTETMTETSLGNRRPLNCSNNDPVSCEKDETNVEHLNYTTGYEKNITTQKQSNEILSLGVEKEAAVIDENEIFSVHKPALSKSLEKLREVIKNDRELEKEGKAAMQPDTRTIFQPHTGPRLQPDVRMDFHPGISPGYSRFQSFAQSTGSEEIRNRFRSPFCTEHPIEIQPNFGSEFQPRFEHRPDNGQRNFNVPQRLQYSQKMQNRHPGYSTEHGDIDLQLPFDPREPPPRLNVPLRQDLHRNSSWLDQNEFPPKFGPPVRINGLQAPPGFNPRGPPPRFMNQDQELPNFGPSIVQASLGYAQIPQMHISHQPKFVPIVNRNFNPTMPPPNTASCIMHKFLPPVPPSSPLENQATLQPPPIPMGALEIQANILCTPPSPPNLPQDINKETFSSANENSTPNMNDELEDMQEALEFAKKLMNMTEEEDDTFQSFNMPTFPDLPPIPSTEPLHLVEELSANESGDLAKTNSQKNRGSEIEKGEQGAESGPPPSVDESITGDSLLTKEKDEAQVLDNHIRRKVVFNVNSRTKRITKVNEWQNQNEEGSLRHRKSREKVLNCSTIPVPMDKKDMGSPSAEIREYKPREIRNERKKRRDDDKQRESRDPWTSLRSPNLSGENITHKETRIENVVEISSKINVDNTKGRVSGPKTATKSLLASTVDANWKDKVINQFLKMSKNDICNMVNSSGLRKFDMAMKHLVKERKYSLSQERRSTADDAVKGSAYDMSREEFMSQLSAMLDPSATVDVKNLPSKFIQHLSEVLKLDVESHLNDGAELAEENNVNNSFGNDEENLFANYKSENLGQFLDESNVTPNYCTYNDISNDIKTEMESVQEIQMSAGLSHLLNNTKNGDNSINESLPNMAVIDDIFSEGIARTKLAQKSISQKKGVDKINAEMNGEIIPHGFIRAKCTKSLISDKNLDLDEIFAEGIAKAKITALKNTESERVPSELRRRARIEVVERWGRKKRQDPDMFRNLTKEEWEARRARSTEKELTRRSRTPSSRDTSISARSHSPRNTDNAKFLDTKCHHSSRNLSPPSPLKEKKYHSNIIVHTPNEAKDEWSKGTENKSVMDNDSNENTSSSNISSDNNETASPKVTKLLKVIKEREKIAKPMSLSETIRDEVTAEIERTKAKNRERQVDETNQKRKQIKKKKECRVRHRAKRKKKSNFEINDRAPNLVTKENAFIKQEELIIEADTQEFLDSGGCIAGLDAQINQNSLSAMDKNDETSLKALFHEDNEAPIHMESTINTQEMFVAQEYASEPISQEAQVQDNEAPETFIIDVEMESSVCNENPLEQLQFIETSNTLDNVSEIKLSKSGAKKIDINAYKARKMQLNSGKQDHLKEIEPCTNSQTIDLINIPRSSQEPEDMVKETRKENISKNNRPRNKDECETSNSTDNLEPVLNNQSILNAQDSSVRTLHKEKSPVPESKAEKREDRKMNKETYAKNDQKYEKAKELSSDDKNRSRNHSRDSERSTSQERGRRTSKERSKHSSQETTVHNVKQHDIATSNLLAITGPSFKKVESQSKLAHQDNYIVEPRDRKSMRHKKCNRQKETTHQRIEKRCSTSKEDSADDKPEHKEAKSEDDCRQESPVDIRQKMITDELKNDDEISKNYDATQEMVNVALINKKISTCVTKTGEVMGVNLKLISMELKLSEETGELNSRENDGLLSSQDENMSDTIKSRETEKILDCNEESTAEITSKTLNPENVFHVEEVEQDSEKNCTSTEDDLIPNETRNLSAIDEEISESMPTKDLNEFHKNKTELTIKNSNRETEKTLKIYNEFKSLEVQDEVITIINELIEKAIAQLDLLNSKNEVERTEVIENEHNFGNEGRRLIEEFTEYTTLEFNSPETPESPLKGFSEESIKTSILGKRRLAQSVLEITEDFMTNKKSKDLDDIMLNTIAENASIPDDNRDENFKEIDSAPEKLRVGTADSFRNNNCPDESESKVETRPDEKETGEEEAYDKDETCVRCVTPSGDTLSLGSSIDFDNGELIVLSEISSDENFSQDEDRRPVIATKLQNHELKDVAEPSDKQESDERAKENKVVGLSMEKTLENHESIINEEFCVIETRENTGDTKSQITHSISTEKLETDIENSIADTLSQDSGKCLEESREPISKGTCELSKPVENDADSSSQLIPKKTSSIADDHSRKKSSVEIKKICKPDKAQSVDTSGKHISDKNLHRVKHRHRMKRKKDKKYKTSQKKIKEALRDEEVVTVVKKQQTKEGVMARMIEIDLEIHKLMSEKLKLYQMLEGGDLPTEQSLLSVGKDGPESFFESVNASRREPDSRSLIVETCRTPTKLQKSSSSKTTIDPTHLKSVENDLGNRGNENQKNITIKKLKKSHKHERPSRQDTTARTESRKSSSDRRIDKKSSSSKRKNMEDKSTRKKYNQSQSSSRRKDEEIIRKEENARKNVALAKETKIDLNKDPAEVCQKNKKIETPRKKAIKISDPKDDSLRHVKKEDGIELRVGTSFETHPIVLEKHQQQIYSDESSQISLSQDCKGMEKSPKGLALLEESFKRERALSQKHRTALCKGKKERSKSLMKPGNVLSSLEEEMPLNLLYVKKFPKKQQGEPLKSATCTVSMDYNMKIKPTTSIEVLDHVLEVINAVAENKTDKYQRSKKIKDETEQILNCKSQSMNRKAKVLGKTKLDLINVPNSTCTPVIYSAFNESKVIQQFRDTYQTKSLGKNISNDDLTKDLDEFEEIERVIGSKSPVSLHDYSNKFPINKIIGISREINASEIGKNKFKAMLVNGEGETKDVKIFSKYYEEGITDIDIGEHEKMSCHSWGTEDIIQSDPPNDHTFNCEDRIPQFDSTFMPQDQMTHSHSISRNFKDIEKGLDVLDSMLETVGSDLETISSKDIDCNFVMKGKRKRKVSGDSRAESDVPAGKRKPITRSEMMNCTVRLVDCKYIYPTNCLKITNSSLPNTTQNLSESHPRSPKSKNSFSSQEALSSENPQNWSLIKYQSSEDDTNYLTPGSEQSLIDVDENSEYIDDDLEIITLQTTAAPSEIIVEEYRSLETENCRLLDRIKSDEFMGSVCDAEIRVDLNSEQMTSTRLSPNCSTPKHSLSEQSTELRLQAKPFSKLTNTTAHPKANVSKVDRIREALSTSESSAITDDESPAKYGDDIQIINVPANQETNEIEEIEPLRIQYSVHKGPILDVKVFGDSILAASEDGVIYRYSQTCNGILNTYEGHKSAVTCIYVLQEVASSGTTRDLLFSGSLDGSLRCFDIKSSLQVRGAADVGSPVQCMDQSWGMIFLGTKSGFVFRFHIKSHAFRGDEIKFSEESVLALKATTEGPRRVLIVASRSQPITIRDAQSGLFLRTVSGHKSHTVYSLLMDSSLVYCGTSNTAIPVFDFINGSQVQLYNAGPGIVCMRMYKWLLFAGCYDGNIYVFDTKEQRLVCSIPGPGNMLLSMDIFRNKVVAGSKDRRLHIWQMPEQVLALLAGRT